MKSLKQLVESMGAWGYSDKDIIAAYFEQDGLTGAVDILVGLLKNSIEELEMFKETQLMWQTMPYDYYYRLYPKAIAPKLDALTRKNICKLPLSSEDIKWAKENIPKYCVHTAMFQPLLDAFHKEGIYFKNENPNDDI